MNEVLSFLSSAVEKNASDILLGVGRPLHFKINSDILPQEGPRLSAEDVEDILVALYEIPHRSMDKLYENEDDDFAVSVQGLAHFRINAYRQRGTMAAVIRVVKASLPNYKELHIPDEVVNVATKNNGLVLVTGKAGSGKSTTLACIVEAINKSRNCHIVTLEDPIEYLHRDNKSYISQREINVDVQSYYMALRSCLRQAPDIILLGEMRDRETIQMALTAADTGQLVISTMHTTGAAHSVNRIVDVFPQEQHQQIRAELSLTLQSVVSQQLLPSLNGGLIPAFEIMHVNEAIRHLIRGGNIYQIDQVIQTSSKEGMVGMDSYLEQLVKDGEIAVDTAVENANDLMQMVRRLEKFK
ncbi:MAG: PilT/PilU family type 4a pilus ATPase [Oscillospiraceae bacterium]|jgi:twitching motility protein PilT|nr:PilT/PilU family type 4a pilus ATPase [Oscillospiraceae bacterium]